MSIRVAIVDDKRDIREGLAFLIKNAAGMICVGSFASADSALTKLPISSPDVVLLDIDLGSGLSGLQCIEPLKKALPSVQIIMLTVMGDDSSIFKAIRSGASGYMKKSISMDGLVMAIEDVHRGGSPISPEVARRILSAHQNPSADPSEIRKLSEREQEVLVLLAQGYEPKEIAEKLDIAYDTIKCHCRAIYQKLEVNSKNQAVRKVFPEKDCHAVARNMKNGNVA